MRSLPYGREPIQPSMSFLSRLTQRWLSLRLKNSDNAPTFLEMDISLSFKTTMSRPPQPPAWLRPS